MVQKNRGGPDQARIEAIFAVLVGQVGVIDSEVGRAKFAHFYSLRYLCEWRGYYSFSLVGYPGQIFYDVERGWYVERPLQIPSGIGISPAAMARRGQEAANQDELANAALSRFCTPNQRRVVAALGRPRSRSKSLA